VTSGNVFARSGLSVWTHYCWPLGHNELRFFRLAEIVQGRGCFESEEVDPEWKVRFGAGGSIRTGHVRAFLIGFTGGTDSHAGWPSRHQGGALTGLTAVYADGFSRAGIMRGIQRRCYATTGTRIVLDFRLNGAAMCSELLLGPRDDRVFTLRVHGTTPLDRVEIVSQGAAIARLLDGTREGYR
jgi:hypothetical protein